MTPDEEGAASGGPLRESRVRFPDQSDRFIGDDAVRKGDGGGAAAAGAVVPRGRADDLWMDWMP